MQQRHMLVAGLLAMAAGGADAAVSIVAGGMARECFLAAELKRDYRTSVDICDRALEEGNLSRRDRAATMVNRGILFMHARALDRAISDYRVAIRLQPKIAESHVNLGIALLQRGGQDRLAIAALTQGLELGPSRPEIAYYTRAVAHEIAGNAREAYEDYIAAAAARPDWDEPVEQLKRFTVERRKTGSG